MERVASQAHQQLQRLVEWYTRFLPLKSFPWVPFAIAAAFQVFAWFGGRFLGQFTIVSRVLILWLFALGEYGFMSPAMNASTEVLRMSESTLVVLYHAITLAVFMVINTLVFKNTIKPQHVASYGLLIVATYLAFL